jgi:hypothetical protein
MTVQNYLLSIVYWVDVDWVDVKLAAFFAFALLVETFGGVNSDEGSSDDPAGTDAGALPTAGL